MFVSKVGNSKTPYCFTMQFMSYKRKLGKSRNVQRPYVVYLLWHKNYEKIETT